MNEFGTALYNSMFLLGSWERFPKLGCDFNSKDYAYNAPADMREAAFGNKYIPALNFDNVTDYYSFFAKVDEFNQEVLENTNFNSLDDYIKFYKKYKQEEEYMRRWNLEMDFEHFYRSYKIDFSPNTEATGITIHLLDRITEANSEAAASSYLVTVATDISDDKLDRINVNFTHGHVAGVVKVMVGGRLGYLLVDPTLGMMPQTVMADGGRPPIYTNTSGTSNPPHPSVAHTLVPNSNYIVSKPHPSYMVSNVYDVSSPFCSAMETATKQKLLHRGQYMIKRDKTGLVTTSLGIEMEYIERNPALRIVQIENGKHHNAELNLIHNSSENVLEEKVYSAAWDQFRISSTTLESYRSDLLEISKDSKFLMDSQNLLNYLKTPSNLEYTDKLILSMDSFNSDWN